MVSTRDYTSTPFRRFRVLLLLPVFLLLTACPLTPKFMASVEDKLGAGEGDACNTVEYLMTLPDPTDPEYNDHLLQRPYIPPTDPNNPEPPVIEDNNKGVVDYIVTFTREKLDYGVEILFNNIIGDDGDPNNTWYQNTINATFTLVIILYGISVLMGMTQAHPYMVIMTFIKLLILYALATDYDLFADYVKDFFEGAVDDLTNIMAGFYGYETGNYQFMDETISMFFSFRFYKILLALLPAGGFGWLAAVLMVVLLVFYTMALLRAVYILVLTLVGRSLLYATAPIFFLFGMFQYTARFFVGWIKMVTNLSLQPVILFAFLGLIHRLMVAFFKDITRGAQSVCYESWTDIVIGLVDLHWWFFIDENNERIAGFSAQLPIDIFVVMMVSILGFIMFIMVGWTQEVSKQLIQGVTAGFEIPMQAWGMIQSRITGAAARPAGFIGGAILGTRDKFGVRRGGVFFSQGQNPISSGLAGWKSAARRSARVSERHDRALLGDE